jgi:hypothetical protein
VKRRAPDAGQRGPVELLEHAAELCVQDLGASALQAAATLAFTALLAWGALYCLRSPRAFESAGALGLGLAAAYALLKLLHNHFSLRLARRLGLVGAGPPRWGARLRNQLAWQPWSFLCLPLSALALLPYPFVSAFFHNLGLLDDGSQRPWPLALRAWALARRSVLQLNLAHQLLLGLAFLAFVNLWALFFGVAYLLHDALSYRGSINLDPEAALNSTTLLLVTGAAWAVVLPLTKAMHALRASEAEAESQGQDLAARLEALGPLET